MFLEVLNNTKDKNSINQTGLLHAHKEEKV